MMRWFLEHISRLFRLRLIYDREGDSPYLSRFYLLGGPRDMSVFYKARGTGPASGETSFGRLPVNVMLHKFHRSDDDGALHNHPWKWSLSLILAGGYSEERRVPTECSCGDRWCNKTAFKVVRRVMKPFRLNFIRGNDFHRVDLLEKDAWSLFIAGPKAQSWGFWDRFTYQFTPWREFIARRRHHLRPDDYDGQEALRKVPRKER